MGSPIELLLPELLIAAFNRLELPERTLCAMASKFWWALVKKYWPDLKTTPQNLLDWAAKNGSLVLMNLAKDQGVISSGQALRCAALRSGVKSRV